MYIYIFIYVHTCIYENLCSLINERPVFEILLVIRILKIKSMASNVVANTH